MNEKWRQRLHLEPPRGWLNDPNGLCWFKDKYHVYFQYAPDNVNGGVKKCWGHYQSPDMISWEFTGTVLVPDIPEDKDGVYSGSAVVNGDELDIFYTGNVKHAGDYDYVHAGREANVIRVTTKDGHNMSPKRVILRNSDYPDFCCCHVRDPKVWYENGRYNMVLGARTKDDRGCALFYVSSEPDKWEYAGAYTIPDMGYMWECPDCITVDEHKYLSISPQGLEHGTEKNQNIYSSGYLKEGEFTEWDYGFDFYAPQTFEAPDGRRILIGWMGMGDTYYKNPTAELGRQHCLTVPREITRLNDGALAQNPIGEYSRLRTSRISPADNARIALPFDLSADTDGDFEIVINGGLILKLEGDVFSIEFKDGALGCGRDIRRVRTAECRDIRIIADMSSLEIYLDGGRYVMSTRFYPSDDNIKIGMRGIRADVYGMRGTEVRINGE